MELTEIKSRLDSLGIPVAYMRFRKPQSLPFAVYYESGTEIKGADNYNLYRDVTINIELYTEKKQPQLERQLENLFRDREIDKSPDIYIKDEDMYMTSFSFDTIQYIEEE
ncbi:hypothetical protein [Ruminococcus flavefaciens]|uniref:hypothetical protein n=1 Tax=Ruminococcus flavefaciens TaxID=1265 RepID=UPI001562F230|nr:hypothetical protein [Ruminococcus flavefaciens]